jgi:hypothetical protein
VGTEKATYTMDDKMMVEPEGDINGLKTHAHWDGSKLHLHFKKGMNWGRDILSMQNGKLVVTRDVESGGGSTTFTITRESNSPPTSELAGNAMYRRSGETLNPRPRPGTGGANSIDLREA